MWTVAEVLFVAFAVFAAARDIAAASRRRPLKGKVRVVVMAIWLVVLLWLAALLLLPGDRVTALRVLIGLLLAIPVVPVAALAVPGTILFRRSRHA